MPNPAKIILLASAPIQLDAAAKELPKRIKLMNWGANPGAKGTFSIGEHTLKTLAANQAASNFDRVAFDFEHNTVKGSPSYQGEPAKVAGHGTPEVVRGEGLFLNSIEWTQEGRDYVGGRHYIDVSPSIITNAAGEVVFLHSAAACRQGALVGGSINLSASDFPNLRLNQATEENITMKDLLIKLLNAAGVTIAADASAEEVQTATEEFAGKLKTMSAAGAPVTLSAEVLAALRDLPKSVQTLAAEVQAIKAKDATDEIKLILNAAAAEGKVVPKEAVEGATAMTAPQLKLLVASLPVTVPLERRTPQHTPDYQQTLVTNSAEDAVRRQLGISEDEWKKTA